MFVFAILEKCKTIFNSVLRGNRGEIKWNVVCQVIVQVCRVRSSGIQSRRERGDDFELKV